MVQTADFSWERPLFAAADEAILSQAVATIENATANQAGGMTRFPGLKAFAEIPGDRIYPVEWDGDLYAANNQGRFYRIGRDASVTDVTGVPISGGRRVMFEAGEDRLLMAAGGPIIELVGRKTVRLSNDAPETTHVAYIDGYLLAIERWSNRFQHTPPGQPTVWNAIDVFSANAKPFPVTAMLVSPYRELFLAGPKHIEQFERLPNGSQPFSRRWTTGQGIAYPYTLVSDDTGTYAINLKNEFVRFAGQVSQDQGDAVSLVLASIDDWTDAWAQAISLDGEAHIVLQMPMASNVHGTKGVTLLLALRTKRWSFLYGFDRATASASRYPAWAFAQAWGRVFAGVPGGIAVLDRDTYENLGEPAPFLIRSGHVDKFGTSRIDGCRLRMKRGVGRRADGRMPLVGLRVNRDNEGFGQWQWEPLGEEGQTNMVVEFGPQGIADTWQFEIRVSDPVQVEFVSQQIRVERLRW